MNIECVTSYGKVYQRVNGTYYDIDTPESVIQVLENARLTNRRIRVFLGDKTTGRDWNEEFQTVGYVARSSGPVKVPILLANARSDGGSPISTDSIVRLETSKGGRLLWKHEKYYCEPFTMRESEMAGYAIEIMREGEVHARFETRASAERWLKKMSR